MVNRKKREGGRERGRERQRETEREGGPLTFSHRAGTRCRSHILHRATWSRTPRSATDSPRDYLSWWSAVPCCNITGYRNNYSGFFVTREYFHWEYNVRGRVKILFEELIEKRSGRFGFLRHYVVQIKVLRETYIYTCIYIMLKLK